MTTAPDIVIPEWFLLRIVQEESEQWRKVRGDHLDVTEIVNHLASGYRQQLLALGLYMLENNTKAPEPLPDNPKILEIGSGNGFMLCLALNHRMDIIGVEPGVGDGFSGRRERAIALLRTNGIEEPEKKVLDCCVENLPFPKNTFDAVVSTAVLEHVQDVWEAMNEMLRVLKPGGILWANLPNYDGCYEAHYNLFWIPGMSKRAAKQYVGALHRDPRYIDRLNFVTPQSFKMWLDTRECSGRIYLHGRGLAGIVFTAYNCCVNPNLIPGRKMHNAVVYVAAQAFHFRIVRAALRPPLWCCVKILEWLGLATSFDLVLHKKES